MKVLALVVLLSYPAFTQQTSSQASSCVVTFTVITEDALKNVKQGLLPKDAEWASKLTKKFPGVCYVEPDQRPSAVLYISVAPDPTMAHERLRIHRRHPARFAVLSQTKTEILRRSTALKKPLRRATNKCPIR